MLKIILVLQIFLISLSAQTYKNISLLDYAELVSHTNKKEIFINEDIMNQKISFFMQNDIQPTLLMDSFKFSLEGKGLQLTESKGVLYVQKKQEIQTLQSHPLYPASQTTIPIVKDGKAVDYTQYTQEQYKQALEKRQSYTYDLKYLSYKDVTKMLKAHKDILFAFLPSANSIIYFAHDEEKAHIKNLIKKYDRKVLQKSIKLTVFTTNRNKIKEIGSDISNFGFDLQNYLQLLSNFGATRLDLETNNKANFYAILKFLNEKGITEINQSPTMLLRDGEKASFNSVKNIPYLTQKKEVTDNQTSTQDSYEYKDVGLKIQMIPKVFDTHTLVDFRLSIEDILTSGITPITSKIELSNIFDLKDGELLLISGLNRSEHIKKEKSIPLLSSIPYLGNLFRYESVSNANDMLSIMIEVVQ